MPVKISVGLSRKVGERNYSSRGASVGLELEADVELIRDPRRLQQQLAHLFGLAKQSLDQQLFGDAESKAGSAVNGRVRSNPATDRAATPRQTRAILALANRLELDLASQLSDRFGVARPGELSLSQASELIDAWSMPSHQNGEP